MKGLYVLLAMVCLFSANLAGQDYSFRYNPYSGMNKDQLELAFEQSQKMKRSGMVWSAVGAGMFVGGSVLMFDGIHKLTYDEPANFGSFASGLGIMCLGAFPLGYGLVAWITGNEKSNMIEIELLDSNIGTLGFKPTDHGFGLVLAF